MFDDAHHSTTYMIELERYSILENQKIFTQHSIM